MTENEPKTRKRRKETAEGDDSTEVVKPRKEKRKREDTEDSGVTKPKKEKRKREDTVDGAEDSAVTKPKKEKRRRKDPADGAEDATIQVEEPPKKKHKNKTGFPDPGEDSESLSDQARKGEPAVYQLVGVFTSHNSPLVCVLAISETVKMEIL
jgi:hypothetical protein